MQAFEYHDSLLYISLAVEIFPPQNFQQLASMNVIIRES